VLPVSTVGEQVSQRAQTQSLESVSQSVSQSQRQSQIIAEFGYRGSRLESKKDWAPQTRLLKSKLSSNPQLQASTYLSQKKKL
jgi:hypothetical protein